LVFSEFRFFSSGFRIPNSNFCHLASDKPHGWKTNPIDSFYKSQAVANAANAKPKYDAANAKEAEVLATA